jgi:hypothetical protein
VSIGTLAAEHRGTCRVRLVIDYPMLDLLQGAEAYPGPTSKPGHRGFRRLEWHSGVLSLASHAPVSGRDAKALGFEIGEAATGQMFRNPLLSMRLPVEQGR